MENILIWNMFSVNVVLLMQMMIIHHQFMMISWQENTVCITGPLSGESNWIWADSPDKSDTDFDVSFDASLNTQLNKESSCQWLEVSHYPI